MITPPRVSVIMPVRNGGRYLKAAVDSILCQTLADIELIAIDDGSTDETQAVLQRFAESDARVTLLSTGGDGIVAALNLGVSACRAPLIARMDSDDIAMPNRLSLQVALMAANPALAGAGSQAIRINAEGREIGPFSVPADASSISDQLLLRNPFIHPTMILRKSAVGAVGGYRSCCAYAEDYDLWLRLAERGALTNLAEPTLWFREHASQTSRKKRLAQRAATALARQLAQRRREGLGEGIGQSQPMPESCAAYLVLRLADTAKIKGDEAKDLAVMLRFVHLLLPGQTGRLAAERIAREGGIKKATLLKLRLAIDRAKARFM